VKILYKQRYGITLVSYLGLIGLTSIRPGDKYDKILGFSIALVKAHVKLNKRELALADKLESLPWKKVTVPEESLGAIVATARQYRQAIGQVKRMVEDKWDDNMPPDYLDPKPYNELDLRGEKLVDVSKNGKGQPVCQIAEAFGRRLQKLRVL
jgi:hypothetical protein